MADPLIGATFAGKYTISRLLARGGMGVVYLAREKNAAGEEREVVIKVLAPNWIDNPEAMVRFQREGQRLGGLQHPNIVMLHECGHERGVAYLVMEYLVGELLSDFLARKGRLAMEEFVPIAAQILKGLGYAHSRGLMHRDIKPSNIILTIRKGRAHFVKILDFGMAKLVEGEQNVTAEQIVGTANYMAPEQIRGGGIDVRVDVYALGVLFYLMLSGRMPFEGESAALLFKHVHEDPPLLESMLPVEHDVPVDLLTLVHQCLAKDPEARPADADALVEAMIDCCPASMFHLPIADGNVGGFGSSTSMAGPASSADLSMLDLTRPSSRRGKTREGLHPRAKLGATPPKTVPALSPTLQPSTAPLSVSTGIAVDPESSRRKRGFAARAAGGVLGGVMLAVFLWGRGDPTARVNHNAMMSEERRLTALLEQIEGEIVSGRFETAQRHLEGAAQDLERHPQLRMRADVSRTRIAVANSLENAQRLESEDKVPAAMSAYKDILAIDPHHPEALAALARLTEGLGAGQTIGVAGGKSLRPGLRARAPASAPASVDPQAELELASPPGSTEDPFLPLNKQAGHGIFLPVGGKQ